MRVKMLTRAAGPDWKADAGVEIDLPLNVAAGLVSGGYAEALEKGNASEPPPVVETAAIDPHAERAVKSKPRKR